MIKKIIIITVAGIISFSATFTIGWLTAPKKAPALEEDNQAGESALQQENFADLVKSGPSVILKKETKKAMTEKQLRSLIYEVREKIQEYSIKLKSLEVEEERSQIAHKILKSDIDELKNLRVELASTIASLKEQHEKLLNSRVEIKKMEKNNLITIAATYDKMDSASAGKILTNMSFIQDGEESSINDVVKILYYMTERTKAKLLAELSTSEPKLTAILCQQLKKIVEKE